MGTKLKILDYNIRFKGDGENKMIDDRAPRLEALIRKYDPDIIGLQEATPQWIQYLEDHLYDTYRMRFLYRNENSREATPILWKKDKFNTCREGHFWLSDFPEVSTKSYGTGHYRICNWIRFQVKESGEEFFFVNTHMGGGNASARSAELIMKRMEERGAFTEYPALLTGDFNAAPYGVRFKSDCYRILNESGKFKDLNADLGFDPSTTGNGYNEPRDTDVIIDYVFYTPSMMKPLAYKVLNENYFGGWISDHRGLYAEVELKD